MLLIAHRGASGYAPENTIASFKKAIDMGMKAVEFDVQLTKDRKLVVIHDFSLERTTTGNGRIEDLTLEEIREADAGSWYSNEYAGEKVPVLEEILEIVRNNELINIEVKRDKKDKRSFAKELLETIRKFKIKEKVIVSSFDHELLQDIYKEDNDIAIGLLFKKLPRDLKGYIDKLGISVKSINPLKDIVNSKSVEGIKELGLEIYSFTVNDREKCIKLGELGVEGVFTNYPDLMK